MKKKVCIYTWCAIDGRENEVVGVRAVEVDGWEMTKFSCCVVDEDVTWVGLVATGIETSCDGGVVALRES